MDLSFLIPSKVRREVLRFFVENPSAEMGVRELARELKLSPQVTHRELVNLENWGFLFSSKRGNSRAFRVNEKFALYGSIQSLYRAYQAEQNRQYEVLNVLNWDEMQKEYAQIPVPQKLLAGLQAKRTKPRAYMENKIMKRKNML